MASSNKLKLQIVTWDSDKNPHGYADFIDNFGSVVRCIEHGPFLEDFLDYKLKRKTARAATTPSFISKDDDFSFTAPAFSAPADPAHDSQEHPNEQDQQEVNDEHDDALSVMSDGSSTATLARRQTDSYTIRGKETALLPSVPDGYACHQWAPEVRKLDKELYNHLRTNISGTCSDILKQSHDSSYVQAVAALHKHIQCSQVAL